MRSFLGSLGVRARRDIVRGGGGHCRGVVGVVLGGREWEWELGREELFILGASPKSQFRNIAKLAWTTKPYSKWLSEATI